MHTKYVKNGISAKKENNCIILASPDLVSSAMHQSQRLNRRQFAQGPKYTVFDTMIHNDKLKPYGVCMHGCIHVFFSTKSSGRVIGGPNNQTVHQSYDSQAYLCWSLLPTIGKKALLQG